MKYIFDFDDVLFYTTKMFKEHMYTCLEEAGIPQKIARGYYKKKISENEFSLKNFISTLLIRRKVTKISSKDVYKQIMSECKNFTNTQLIKKVKKLGKKNCFMITNGEQQFHKDKIRRSGITPLFSKIYIVPGSKKEIIYDICAKYKNEQVIFIEDKIKFIKDIDPKKSPNLKTILYVSQNSDIF